MRANLSAYLGWVATCVFAGSYFFRRAGVLRALQMCGAALWILYGFLIHAIPVIAANALVFVAAAWTARQPWSSAELSKRRASAS